MNLAVAPNGTNIAVPSLKQERCTKWSAFDFVSTHEDISNGIEWSIHDERHAIIVHLSGAMSALETELDGRGKSFGPANAGEVWIVPAGTRYASRARGEKINYGVIFLRPDSQSTCLIKEKTFSHIAPLHGHRDDFCFHAVEKLIECTEGNDDMSRMLGESISEALSLHLFRQYGGDRVNIPPPHSEQVLNDRSVRMLQEYIYEHISEVITLSTLSVLAEMSIHNFLIAFRQAFGTTPAQYIITQRLRRVQWLLVNCKDDITSIAYATGFSSHSHLATTFKKHLHRTPSQFRSGAIFR